MILDNNPSVEKVYLGLSYHSLSNYYDRFISGDYSAAVAPKYFYLLPPKEKLKMIKWNISKLIPFMKSVFRLGLNKNTNNDRYSYLGGFINKFNKSTAVNKSMDKRLETQYYSNGKLNPFSKLNIYYLDKIISLCNEKDVVLITLNTPLHEYYLERVPIEYKKKLKDIIKSRQLRDIDLSTIELKDSCYIPDGDHVSKIGSEKTSIRLKKIIH